MAAVQACHSFPPGVAGRGDGVRAFLVAIEEGECVVSPAATVVSQAVAAPCQNLVRTGSIGVAGVASVEALAGRAGSEGAPRLWADVAKGTATSHREALSDEFLEGKVKISYPDGEDGEPVINIDKIVIDALAEGWASSIIIKPLGLKLHFDVMLRKLREVWRMQDEFELVDIPRGYFIALLV